MKISLAEHFTYRKLLRFVLPSVSMMIVTSLYTIVDGFFVSNFVGKNPFAALNLVWPFLTFIGMAGFMIGSGGNHRSGGYNGSRDRNILYGKQEKIQILLNKIWLSIVKPSDSLLIYFDISVGSFFALEFSLC